MTGREIPITDQAVSWLLLHYFQSEPVPNIRLSHSVHACVPKSWLQYQNPAPYGTSARRWDLQSSGYKYNLAPFGIYSP